jgi:serine/threonine protein kinase/tetratricopeptide (TPR) repeat protein
MSALNRCRECGNVQADGALSGLCPVCLLRAGVARDEPEWNDIERFSSVTHRPIGRGGLATLTEVLASGEMPQVLLRDSDVGGDPGPLVKPGSPEMPPAGDRLGRLQLLGEIARGGMGAVLKGRDPDLGRDLAVKVLLESHRDKPDLVRRFVEEAQIGGQLQHPGIVPVYELGAFADRRPYFAMKLVKGRTLSSLLDERQPPDPSSTGTGSVRRSDQGIVPSDRDPEAPSTGRPEPARDLPRFLSIFGAVCQTIAYAHARGVIHRDLKPSNIMVGSFGEVQVMDWGLAKVLPQGGAAEDASAGKLRAHDTVVATARSGSDTDSDLSKAGSVMGTPSYMAPEQARGEIDRLDERCDVFALGAILCELLTGEPAFTGRSSGEIQRNASRGDLTDAIDRLNCCGADAELIALAKRCLAPELEDRPRHASEVTARIDAYQTGVQERLRQAEIARAEEKARALEATKRVRVERDRLRLTIALAVSVLGLVVLGGALAFWAVQQRQNRLTAAEALLARVQTLHDQAKARGSNPVEWREALAAADQALAGTGDLANSPPGRRLAAMRVAIAEDEKQAERDNRLMTDLANFRARRWLPNSLSNAGPESGYVEAFQQFGLDLEATPVDQAVVRLKSLPEASRREVVEFLDDWAIVRIELEVMRGSGDYKDAVAKLMAVARGLDSDADRNRLRSLLDQPNLQAQRDTLVAMAKNGRAVEFGPSTSILLASALEKARENSLAIAVLRAAVVRYPGDLWANLALANRLAKVNPPRHDEAIRYYAIVRALRPVTGSELASLLIDQGQADEAEAIHRELVRLQPDELSVSGELFELLERRGKKDQARAVLERWIDRFRGEHNNPVAHFQIGLIFRKLHDRAHEIAELREAARLDSRNPDFNHELGHTLLWENDLRGAIEAYREAIRIFPKDINCHYELAFALCRSGDHPGEIAALRDAIRLDSTLASGADLPRPQGGPTETFDGWNAFCFSNDNFWQEYFDDFDQGHLALGNALVENGDLPGAIAEYREAIRLGEGDKLRHYKHLGMDWSGGNEGPSHPRRYLGMALVSAGDLKGAIAEFREVIRILPELVSSDVGLNLCLALARSGDPAGAIVVVQQAIQQGTSHRLEPIPLLGAIVVADRADETIRTLRSIREQAAGDRAVVDWIDSAISLTERIATLGPRLPRIVHSASRRAASYAGACSDRRFFAASASLWSAAFAVDPALLENSDEDYRYKAACSAAMAGCGQGKDDPPPDETVKAKLRRQAIEWLRAELAARMKRLEGSKPEDRADLVWSVRRWKDNGNLAGVRDETKLEKLPEQERKAWQALWADVAAVLRKSGE